LYKFQKIETDGYLKRSENTQSRFATQNFKLCKIAAKARTFINRKIATIQAIVARKRSRVIKNACQGCSSFLPIKYAPFHAACGLS
jgi:hypothetical protein